MKKSRFWAAGFLMAGILALSTGSRAMANELVTGDKDYGMNGQTVSETAGWGSSLNGQFLIQEGQTVSFHFASHSLDTSVAVFGWVAEVTDNENYFTITQGATCWFAPEGTDWKKGYDNGKNSWDIQKSWSDREQSEYAIAVEYSTVDLKVTRAGKQIIFDSVTQSNDGRIYTQKVTATFQNAVQGDLYIQLGVDHGSMTLYNVKYSGNTAQATTKETATKETTTKETTTKKEETTKKKEEATTKKSASKEETTTKKSDTKDSDKSTSSADKNLSVSLTTNREEYDADDTIRMEVSIKNISDSDIKNLAWKAVVPSNMTVKYQDDAEYSRLDKGETLTTKIKVYSDEDSKTDEDTENTFPVILLIGGGIAIVVIIAVIILIIIKKHNKKKRNNNQFISYLLIFALLGAAIPSFSVQAMSAVEKETTGRTKTNTATASQTVKVDGKNVELAVEITYETTMAQLDESTNMTLTYQFWEDGPIVDTMLEDWSEKHPNITIKPSEVLVSDNNQILVSYMGTSNMPDIFWILGSPDFALTKEMLADMTGMWDADENTANVIGGINEYELGYFGTDKRWAFPIKFYPCTAWLNMNAFLKYNINMPSADWTFEDMEECVEKCTSGDGQAWGVSEALSVVDWYPIASDNEATGQFGWNGKEFDLTNWADGMKIKKDWTDKGYIAPAVMNGTDNVYPQDEGAVAVRLDNWWSWERYWDRNDMYTKHVYYVPYILPHTEMNYESETNLAVMDFGGIYADTKHPREAYEALKYFTWSADGWKYKLANKDEIEAIGKDSDKSSVSGLAPTVVDNCPITLDESVWKSYEKQYPTTLAGGDIEGQSAYGIDRSSYFDAFFEKVKDAEWTCFASQQLLGVYDFLEEVYLSDESKLNYQGYGNIQDAVIIGGEDPDDYVSGLTELINQYHDDMVKLCQ